MGFELDARVPTVAADLDDDAYGDVLERRWRFANERLAEALAVYAALRGRLAADDPAWQAAQLKVAQARQRCREVGDELDELAAGAGRDRWPR